MLTDAQDKFFSQLTKEEVYRVFPAINPTYELPGLGVGLMDMDHHIIRWAIMAAHHLAPWRSNHALGCRVTVVPYVGRALFTAVVYRMGDVLAREPHTSPPVLTCSTACIAG